MKLIFIFLLMLSTFMNPGWIFAQTDSLRISGFITAVDGQPLSEVKVIARGGDSSTTTTTDNSGFYSLNLIYHETRIDQSPKQIPDEFILSQNYPNPFFAKTTIPFTLSNSGKVSLTIYNIMGQQVHFVERDGYPAGLHQITWNGRNENGRLLSAGIYFYRLQTPSGARTRKMLLLDTPQFTTPFNSTIRDIPSFQKSGRRSSQITLQAVKAEFDLFEENLSVDAQISEIQKDIVLKPMGFLPLAVGNRWMMMGLTHQNKEEWESFSISEKKIIDGQEYFNFAGTPLFQPVWGLVRKDEKGDIFIRVGEIDLLIYEFSNPILDSMRTVHIDTLPPHYPEGLDILITLQSIEDTVMTDSITYENCFRYDVCHAQWVGSGTNISFAPNFGPVSHMVFSTGIKYKLKEIYLNRGITP